MQTRLWVLQIGRCRVSCCENLTGGQGKRRHCGQTEDELEGEKEAEAGKKS
jgi:hypothetical protein